MTILRDSDASVNPDIADLAWWDSFNEGDYVRRGRQVEPAPDREMEPGIYDPSFEEIERRGCLNGHPSGEGS